MNDNLWTDGDLRRFLIAAPELAWRDDWSENTSRAQFVAQSPERIAAPAQRRLLERIGALTDPEGLTFVALELVESCNASERAWLLASTEPWRQLSDWVAETVTRSYKSPAFRKSRQSAQLSAIAKATRKGDADIR